MAQLLPAPQPPLTRIAGLLSSQDSSNTPVLRDRPLPVKFRTPWNPKVMKITNCYRRCRRWRWRWKRSGRR